MKSIELKLKEFISIEKFTDELWESRGLISSGIEMSNNLNKFFNQCAEDLIKSKEKKFKDCLKGNIKKIDSIDYDTEEREFIIDYFVELADICAVDLKKELMEWMYGEDFPDISKPKNKSTGEIIYNTCTKCGGALDTEIIERQKGIPDFAFTIIKCNDCSELNLIELGAGIKEFKFGNYTIDTYIEKSEYSKEQAMEKLKELKSKK